jgi:hypothetical protein
VLFTSYWLRKIEDEQIEKAKTLLGVHWKRDDMIALAKASKAKGKSGPPQEILVPLSIAVNPNLQTALMKLFEIPAGGAVPIGGGEYTPDKKEEVVELGETSKETFLSMFNPMLKNMQSNTAQKPTPQTVVSPTFDPKNAEQAARIAQGIEKAQKARK